MDDTKTSIGQVGYGAPTVGVTDPADPNLSYIPVSDAISFASGVEWDLDAVPPGVPVLLPAPLRVYVAGKFEEKEAIRDVQRMLRDRGAVITFDWTQAHEVGLEGEARDRYYAANASQDLLGVSRADVVIAIDHPRCRGMFIELGFALALRVRVILVEGEGTWEPTAFHFLPEIERVKTVEEAVALAFDRAPDLFEVA